MHMYALLAVKQTNCNCVYLCQHVCVCVVVSQCGCSCCWYDHKFVALLHCQLLCVLFIFVQNFPRENSQWPDDRYEVMVVRVYGGGRASAVWRAKGYGQKSAAVAATATHKSIKCCFWRLHIDLTVKITARRSPGHTADRWARWKRWVVSVCVCVGVQECVGEAGR